MTWHANCYECLGKGTFPMRMHQDAQGNPWFKQQQKEDEINQGVRGAHASMSFQCERCWFINLEGRLPDPRLDEMYLMLIRRANLDAIGGRAMTTTKAHAGAIKRIVWNCETIRKTPTIPPRGPAPLWDAVGMSVAVDMLHNSLTGVARVPGETHIQFESMRRVRATFTKTWISSPQGIAEGAAFSSGYVKSTLTSCPTEQELFSRFLRGCEIRMGYATKANRSLTTKTIVRLLELIKQEALAEVPQVAREYWKVGAAIALAICGSLRGPEILRLDLAGLREHIGRGREGVLPDKPLKTGTDLTNAPHIMVVLIGDFKGETGIQHHAIALASLTMSGIPLRWWLEKLLEVRTSEGCSRGPALATLTDRWRHFMNTMGFFITSYT